MTVRHVPKYIKHINKNTYSEKRYKKIQQKKGGKLFSKIVRGWQNEERKEWFSKCYFGGHQQWLKTRVKHFLVLLPAK